MTGSQEHLLEDAEYPQLCRYTASNALHWQYGSLKASGLGCRWSHMRYNKGKCTFWTILQPLSQETQTKGIVSQAAKLKAIPSAEKSGHGPQPG
ncbi:hypothetical protein Y1Q_0021838 [Alligator mississippiensis]|uniref:Uncharacterized protein n=1 Tax=Alligator mississippiensis TaxID=8496 RepID=A0A151PBA7_ALLMI|nr:hypothetical protein Y1Q_0021838 [Alligator mississippiensis]